MGAKYSKKRHKPRISKSQIPWLLRGAIRSNNVGTLQYLFSYPNRVDPSMVIDGVCPLNLAVELGYLQMVKILLKAGADIYVADAPRYPLHQASLYGRAAIAELLIRSGASISALTERRQSCLHLLTHQSASRFIETANILLKYHINPNTLDDDGLAPLHCASIEMVNVLVLHDATDVNICSRDGDTPLLTAVKDRRETFLITLIKADQQYREQFLQKNSTTTPNTNNTPTNLNNNNNNNNPNHSKTKLSSLSSNELQSNDEQLLSDNCFNLRKLSSKSSNSGLTLTSTNNVLLQIDNGNRSKFLRKSSSSTTTTTYVNIHSVLSNLNTKSLIITTNYNHSNHNQLNYVSLYKFNSEHENNLILDSEDGKSRSYLQRLSGKNRLLLLNPQLNSHSDDHSTVTSSFNGSSSLFGLGRKTENCQRCHSVGNPSDVAGWWQGRDRVQKLFVKSSTNEINPNSTNQSNTVQPSTGTVRPRLDLDRPDKIGMTPLMIAAEAGSVGLNMAIALVNAGCNVTLTDKVGMTALHHACYVGSLSMVRYLFERNLPISNISSTNSNSITNNNGSNVRLSSASSCLINSPKQINTNSIKHTKLYHPELLNLQDKYGRTLIYLAACRGHSEVVNYLLGHSADIHIPNKEHKSPLYISAYFGYLEIANALLRHGAQVDQTDSHRKTPLYVATYHGRLEIVDLLLAAGANVNATDKNGKTPLYVAVLHGHLILAHKLLDAGASVNCIDCEGLGPLHMAVKFPKLDIPMIKLLLNYGCDPVNLASFTRWLLVHGIIPEECINGDDELAQWLYWEECNVRSLKRICRVVIQHALGNSDLLRTKVYHLPLPEHLISYVSMKEL